MKKLQTYNLGPDELDEYDLRPIKGADYIIYHYKYEDYEGSGISVIKKDGKYDLIELGHCSCFGPLEEANIECLYTLEEVLTLINKKIESPNIAWDSTLRVLPDIRKKLLELEKAQ